MIDPHMKTAVSRTIIGTLSAVAIASFFIVVPANACSDLPNICAAKAVGSGTINQPRDPAAEAMADVYSFGEDVTGYDLKKKMKSPRFKAAYERYQKGGWEYFQDSNNPKPGEYCSALYTKGGAMVRISGPGGDYGGGLMTFTGPDISASPDVKKIDVTLNQSDGTSQSVQAFNYQLPGEPYASIAFSVPTVEAGLAQMKEKWGFDVLVKGKLVLKIEWAGGLAARKQLQNCISKRKSA